MSVRAHPYQKLVVAGTAVAPAGATGAALPVKAQETWAWPRD